jgi:hypothetical protein
MDKNGIDRIEVYFGGGMAVVAIAAIAARCARNGFSIDSVLDGLVNLAQVIVAAMVLLVAVRSILARRSSPETFASTLEGELAAWVARSRPLIVPETEFARGTRYSMLTDLEHMFDVGESLAEARKNKKGKFVDLPSRFDRDAEILFYLNKTTFSDRAKIANKDISAELRLLAARISACVNAKFADVMTASDKGGSNDTATVSITLLRDLQTPEDARTVVHVLDYVMTLYMVAA